MLPLFPPSYETDHPLGNAKHLRQMPLVILAGSVEGDDFGDIDLYQFGRAILATGARVIGRRSFQDAIGMLHILGLGTNLQIAEPTIVFASIEMIDLHSCRDGSIEGFPDQSMGMGVFTDAILAEMEGHIAALDPWDEQFGRTVDPPSYVSCPFDLPQV